MIECKVVDGKIDTPALLDAVQDAASGAIATFIGTVRNSSVAHRESEVMRLEYEAYVPMAEQEMRAIAREASERFRASNVMVHHRIGTLAVGEAAVAVVVSTPHRDGAFDACRYVIEELKKRVPIWKKEVFKDGSEWVNARP